MHERSLRSPETVSEVTVSIARLAHILHEDFGHKRTSNGWHWLLDDATCVRYEDFLMRKDTKNAKETYYKHQAILQLKKGPRGYLREFSLLLGRSDKPEGGVQIYELIYDGSEVELYASVDDTQAQADLLEVHDVLHQGLKIFQSPDSKRYEDQEREFGSLLLDIALDEHPQQQTAEDVVSKILSSPDTKHWLLDEDALRQRAAKRMDDFGGDLER